MNPEKGLFTMVRDEMTPKYMEKAAAIIRILDAIPMTQQDKVLYLAQSFAGSEMYLRANPNAEHSL